MSQHLEMRAHHYFTYARDKKLVGYDPDHDKVVQEELARIKALPPHTEITLVDRPVATICTLCPRNPINSNGNFFNTCREPEVAQYDRNLLEAMPPIITVNDLLRGVSQTEINRIWTEATS